MVYIINTIIEMSASNVINLDGEDLFYTSRMWYGKRYIISYITNYPENIQNYLNQIIKFIIDKREFGSIHSNSMTRCNDNAKIILGGLRFNYEGNVIPRRCFSKEKIILYGSDIIYTDKDAIEEVYGNQLAIIGLSFHALSYISFDIWGGDSIHIAIDTTTTSRVDRYIAELYIGNSKEELEQIIRMRYKYKHYNVCGIYDQPRHIIGDGI